MNELADHISQINILCNKYQVKSLFAFGSVLSDDFNPESDVDLIVDIDNSNPIDYTDNYFSLKFELADLLKEI